VNTSGAIAINNNVLQGRRGLRFDSVGCFISAYDIKTGKQVWVLRCRAGNQAVRLGSR
jgi:hypothetical protein